MELKGKYVVFTLFLLTGIVGALFILLGPRATERSPGVLHLGVRYADEMTIAFTQYPKGGPGAMLELLNAAGEKVFAFENLKIGRNLVPIQGIPTGDYTARLTAPGYRTRELPVRIEGRMLNEIRGVEYARGTMADYNMIGVQFEPVPEMK